LPSLLNLFLPLAFLLFFGILDLAIRYLGIVLILVFKGELLTVAFPHLLVELLPA
jgi:hypothetical protein